MMLHQPVLPSDTPVPSPTPASPPLSAKRALSALDAHRRRLFAQRLACLIERIRARAKQEVAHER